MGIFKEEWTRGTTGVLWKAGARRFRVAIKTGMSPVVHQGMISTGVWREVVTKDGVCSKERKTTFTEHRDLRQVLHVLLVHLHVTGDTLCLTNSTSSNCSIDNSSSSSRISNGGQLAHLAVISVTEKLPSGVLLLTRIVHVTTGGKETATGAGQETTWKLTTIAATRPDNLSRTTGGSSSAGWETSQAVAKPTNVITGMVKRCKVSFVGHGRLSVGKETNETKDTKGMQGKESIMTGLIVPDLLPSLSSTLSGHKHVKTCVTTRVKIWLKACETSA